MDEDRPTGGVDPRAAHDRLFQDTVVPAAFFDALVEELDAEPEIVPALVRAAARRQASAAQ